MSLFDNLEGVVGGLLQGNSGNLLPMVEQALGGGAAGGGATGAGGAGGGVNALLSQLESSGLGAQVASWLGNGSNLPVNAQEIEQALSSQQVQSLAASFGIDTSKVSTLLAQVLPAAVDQASPNGTLTPPSA